MVGRQALALAHVQPGHVVGQGIQGAQAAPDSQAQRQKHHRQQPQTGLDQLAGDVLHQVIALLHAEQHHHLALTVAVPVGKAAPQAGGLTQAQVGKTFGGIEHGWRCITTAADEPALGVPQDDAEGLLVVVVLEVGPVHLEGRVAGGHEFDRAQAQQHAGHAGQVAVGQFVGFFDAGAVGLRHKAQPDHQQGAQRPDQQAPGEGGLGPAPAPRGRSRLHAPLSRGMK